MKCDGRDRPLPAADASQLDLPAAKGKIHMTQDKVSRPRVYVHLTAFWGNDDASSTIKVSRRRWAQLQGGAEYETSASSWYEGERDAVHWRFSEALVSIDGSDGRECILDCPLEHLITETVVPE